LISRTHTIGRAPVRSGGQWNGSVNICLRFRIDVLLVEKAAKGINSGPRFRLLALARITRNTVRYRELAPDRLKKLVRKSRDKTPAPKAISKMLHTRKPSRLSIRAGIVKISPTSLARPSLESMDATFVWGAPDDAHILHRFNPGAGSWVTPRRFARQTLNVICATHCGLRY
jgi:hypothetical protein